MLSAIGTQGLGATTRACQPLLPRPIHTKHESWLTIYRLPLSCIFVVHLRFPYQRLGGRVCLRLPPPLLLPSADVPFRYVFG